MRRITFKRAANCWDPYKDNLLTLASKLGINLPGAKLSEVLAKITSKDTIAKFRELYQSRLTAIWGNLKNGGVLKKLADDAKVAGKLGLFVMFISMVESDLTLAGDPSAPQWQRAYQNFEIAIKQNQDLGYPKGNEVDKAKASLLEALRAFQSGGDTTVMLEYILALRFALDISDLE